MNKPLLELKLIDYKTLNARQQETYNFQKVSGVLADFGFSTILLGDDWQGADFIANHFLGHQFLKVQLKGRLTLDQKYQDKDIWICFRHRDIWYLYPHDAALAWARENKKMGKNPDLWESGSGAWSYPSPPKDFLQWLADYELNPSSQQTASGG
ncbi:MAG: hypothetical protein FWF20_12440 [Betaproteobacteria bacterium]|nr:hypothetical protein [Betaproteobacteria bacterium]MCL2887555.1 hypothetical protein [Betaproteobacteria bacterium]